ncbi:Asp-tRNA(Asn)/Glu-tRNA(Gln) amidotransferase subunit GatB [Candidatus Dependentiae bacterium]
MEGKDQLVTDRYPEYELVIGIEVHVQLKTESKMFCSCQNQFGVQPNSNICQVCTGFLGTLPVINRKAVDYAIMLGLATNCSISKVCEFARKHYMYPDLPKNYQISQDDKPICTDGYVEIDLVDGEKKKIALERIHMEEDAGKNIHANVSGETFVDLNRAGTPLLEIVSRPDISSSEEARLYLTRLRSIVQYLGISDANMEEGSFRGDINISVRKRGDEKLGTRTELKNVNSFRYIVQAIEYEANRQIELLNRGEKVVQSTLLWDEKAHKTVFMRSKEESHDYRYFPDPDLPLLIVDDTWVSRIREMIPELPEQKFVRFQEDFGLSAYETNILTSQRPWAEYFEKVVEGCNAPKQVSNWMLRDLFEYMHETKTEFSDIKIKPEMLAEFVVIIQKGVINSKVARDVFVEMANSGKYPSIIVQEKGLEQISSEEELEGIVKKIIDENPKQVEAYRNGKERLFAFFVGQAMKATSGKANPKVLQDILKKNLNND